MHRGSGTRSICSMLVLAVLSTTAEAIIIRHDRSDDEYRKRGEQYAAVVRILPAETGTLIDRHSVLTAAHIAEGLTGKARPRVVVDGAEYYVTHIHLPPEWNGSGAHDIAVLRLDQSVRNIEPARLFQQQDEKGMQILLVGYGDSGTGLTGPEVRDDTRRAATNRVAEVDDDWLYFTFNAPGDGATDWEGVSGPGDSGGPALIEENDHLLVLGVSSHSFNGKPGRYGTREAYTRVSTHAAWVHDVLAGRLDGSAIIPGEAASSVRGGGQPGTRSRASAQDLSTVAGGALVIAYLEAYNRHDATGMQEFIDAHFSPAYRQRQSMQDMLDWYDRMVSQHFGKLASAGVLQSSNGRIVVRVFGDNGRQGELHVTLNAEGKIDDLQAAIIDAGP